MIRLENVSKFYPTRDGRHYVLNDVSVTLPDDAKIGILGRNGAGKSTLLRLLAGVDVPSAGRIIRTGSISWPIGLVSGLHGSMTGRENARFSCRIQGVSLDDIADKIREIEEFAEVGQYFDMPVSTYSSGMRARVQFGISMAFDFDCYILDEITAVGDQAFRKKSRAVFREKRQDASVIWVSHNFSQLLEDCELGLLLNDGKLTLYDDIADAVDAYTVLTGDNSIGEKLNRKQKGGSGRKVAPGKQKPGAAKRRDNDSFPVITAPPIDAASLFKRGIAAIASVNRGAMPRQGEGAMTLDPPHAAAREASRRPDGRTGQNANPAKKKAG